MNCARWCGGHPEVVYTDNFAFSFVVLLVFEANQRFLIPCQQTTYLIKLTISRDPLTPSKFLTDSSVCDDELLLDGKLYLEAPKCSHAQSVSWQLSLSSIHMSIYHWRGTEATCQWARQGLSIWIGSGETGLRGLLVYPLDLHLLSLFQSRWWPATIAPSVQCYCLQIYAKGCSEHVFKIIHTSNDAGIQCRFVITRGNFLYSFQGCSYI